MYNQKLIAATPASIQSIAMSTLSSPGSTDSSISPKLRVVTTPVEPVLPYSVLRMGSAPYMANNNVLTNNNYSPPHDYTTATLNNHRYVNNINHNVNLNNSINNNNMKHPSLKRVSFGSSKGSMVETLIYDHPLPEEDLSCYQANITRYAGTEVPTKAPSKVRVTFYESQKPHYVSSPETPDDLDLPIMASPSPVQDKADYIRQESTESGRDNPFRPDGDLSKEADEMVGLIKEGKPIVGTPNRHINDITDGGLSPSSPTPPDSPVATSGGNGTISPAAETPASPSKANALYANSNAAKSGANGTAPTGAVTPEAIEVQHGIVVPPTDASQVEHVMIKKKPKCRCCEIM